MSSVSQSDIIELLNLHFYSREFPAPSFGEREEDMLVLNDYQFTMKALQKSLNESPPENIKEVLNYQGTVLTHNNLGGRDGVGSQQEIQSVLIGANYSAVKEFLN